MGVRDRIAAVVEDHANTADPRLGRILTPVPVFVLEDLTHDQAPIEEVVGHDVDRSARSVGYLTLIARVHCDRCVVVGDRTCVRPRHECIGQHASRSRAACSSRQGARASLHLGRGQGEQGVDHRDLVRRYVSDGEAEPGAAGGVLQPLVVESGAPREVLEALRRGVQNLDTCGCTVGLVVDLDPVGDDVTRSHVVRAA